MQLGLSIPDDKFSAIRSGDTTGKVVHPALVYIAQMWGCLLWQNEHQCSNPTTQLEQLQAVLRSLEMRPHPGPVTVIQAHTLIALYLFTTFELEEGHRHLLKAGEVALQYDRTGPPKARPANDTAPSKQQLIEDEYSAAICQLLYLDKCCELVLQIPPSFSGDFAEESQWLTVPSCSFQPAEGPHSCSVLLEYLLFLQNDIRRQPEGK